MDFEIESIELIQRIPQHEKIWNIISPKSAIINIGIVNLDVKSKSENRLLKN